MVEILLGIINTEWTSSVFLYPGALIIVIAICAFKNQGKLDISCAKNSLFFLLFLYCFLYTINKIHYSSFSLSKVIAAYAICPICAFSLGYMMLNTTDTYNYEKKLLRLIVVIAVGCSIHAALNLMVNFGRGRWDLIDFFSDEYLSATNMGSINTVIFSLIICLFICKSKIIKILGIIAVFASLAFSFVLGTRTQVIIGLAVSMISWFLYLVENRCKGISKRNIATFISSIIIIVVFIVFYFKNAYGIKDIIENSNLLLRLGDASTVSSDSYRFDLLKEGVRSLFMFPLGNNPKDGFFHNFWLDIGRVAGIAPVILSLCFFYFSGKHVVKIFVDKEVNSIARYALLGLFIGFNLNFFVEPILDGYLPLFYRYCLISGLIEAFYRYNKLVLHDEESINAN